MAKDEGKELESAFGGLVSISCSKRSRPGSSYEAADTRCNRMLFQSTRSRRALLHLRVT